MKRFLIPLLALLLSHNGMADDRPQIKTLLNEFLDGAAHDIAQHQRFWAEDLIYTSSSGQRFGKAKIIDGMKAAPATPPSVRYWAQDVQIKLYGDTAVVAFKLMSAPVTHGDASQPNKDQADTGKPDVDRQAQNSATAGSAHADNGPQYFNTGTLVKRNNRWQVVAWQATKIPSPSSATAAQRD